MDDKRKDDVHGEGNYKATRDYNKGIEEHMKNHDIEREARDAAPKSEQEQREMDEAERIGKSKSKAGREDGMGAGDGASKA